MLAWFLKIARIVAGVALVLIGLAALITPLTPGGWLLFVGLELLGWRIAYGRYLHDARTWLMRRWHAWRGVL